MNGHHRTTSELLRLLNSRRVWDYPPYQRPITDAEVVDQASKTYALANDSDPFAGARMRTYLANGFELVSDVVHDANSAIARRVHEPKGAFEALEPVKRANDENMAWNQHYEAQYTKKRRPK